MRRQTTRGPNAMAAVASSSGMGDATATTYSAVVTRIYNTIPASIFATARLTPNIKPTTTGLAQPEVWRGPRFRVAPGFAQP